MKHVPPHRWADAQRDAVEPDVLARMDAHAAACERCRTQRARVVRAVEAFADIRVTEAPALGWEHIGARIYWVTSSERRQRRRTRAGWSRALFVAAPAVALTAAALVYLVGVKGARNPDPDSAAVERASLPATGAGEGPTGRDVLTADLSATTTGDPARAGLAPVESVTGLVTFLQGQVDLDEQPLDFDAAIGRGDRIATAEGTVAIQFEGRSSFVLRPHSSVELRAFDRRRIELVLDGEIFVDVAHRAPDQTFVVEVGSRDVSVRGTSFQVTHRDRSLYVACTDGEVEVMSRASENDPVSVSSGRVLDWMGRAPRLRDMAPLERANFDRRTFQVPAWTDTRSVRATTSSLRIAASERQPVDVDGEFAGTGSFSLRVMPGRHHVATRTRPGAPASEARGSWVQVDAGRSREATVPAAPSRRPKAGRQRARALRRAELGRKLMGSVKLSVCVRALRKQNLLEGAFIELELGVLADGTISYLNLGDTNLPRTAARCVRDAVDRIDFSDGPAVRLEHRIEW